MIALLFKPSREKGHLNSLLQKSVLKIYDLPRKF